MRMVRRYLYLKPNEEKNNLDCLMVFDNTFFVKESTKITWEGRSYPIAKMILLGPLNILYFK